MATYEYKEGDIMETTCEGMVISTSAVGLTSNRLDRLMASIYPNAYLSYVNACASGHLTIGRVWGKRFLYRWSNRTMKDLKAWNKATNYVFSNRMIWIIFMSSKIEVEDRSKYEYIEKGLRDIKRFIKENKLKTLAIPAIGCGGDKLDFKKVESIIKKELADVQCHIELYLPYKKKLLEKDKKRSIFVDLI